jgi:WD40 repeat protein
VVSAAWDSTAKVWSLAADGGEFLPAKVAARPREGEIQDPHPAGAVISCDVSPDGVWVAAGAADGHLRLWRIQTSALEADIPAHTDYVLVTKFSPDGRHILAGAFNGSIRLLDTSNREFGTSLGGHQDHIIAAGFSSDSRILLTASGSKIQIWELNSPAPHSIAEWTPPEGGFTMAALAPDGSWAVTGDGSGRLELRAVPSGEATGAVGQHAELNYGTLSPDGTRLATVAADGTLKIWSIPERHEMGAVQAHERSMESCSFSALGKKLVTTSWDGLVKVWQCDALENPIVLSGHIDQLQDACFTPDGEHVFSASMDGSLRFWDAVRGTEIGSFLMPGDSAGVCVLSADGRNAVSASQRAARVWSSATGAVERTLRGHTLEVSVCAFSPDGLYLVTASADHTLKLWNSRTWREIRTYRGHNGPVSSCAVSASGERIASGSRDGTVRIWKADSDEPPVILEGTRDWVTHVLWKGEGLVSASGRTVLVHDPGRRAVVESFSSSGGAICSMGIATDGSRLICGMADGAVGICDLGSGSPMILLGGHSSAVRCCAFSADGLLAYTGSMDRTVRIWDVRERKPLRVLAGHEHWVLGGAFSPSGGLLFSGSQDHYLKVWDVRGGTQVCEYWAGAPVQSIALDSRSPKLTLGDAVGQLHFLEFQSASPWAAAVIGEERQSGTGA